MTVTPALLGADIQIPGTTWAMAAGPDAIPVALGMRHSSIDVDIETFGLGPLSWKIKCVTISDGHTAAVLDPREPTQYEVIARVLADAPELVFYNSPFDVPILVNNKLMHVDHVRKVVDPLIWARMVEPDSFTSKSLEAVGDRYGVLAKGKPIGQTFKELGISKSEGFHKFDISVVSYLYGAALDSLVTHHVSPLLRAAAKKALASNPYTGFRIAGSELEHMLEREQVVNRVLLRRACLGLRVDFDFAADYRAQNQAQIDIEEAQLKELGIKPGDGGSLLKWMDGMGLIGPEHPKTPTGKLQATAAVLEDLAHPIAATFVSHKRKVKVDRDYLAKMEELSLPTGGRIHPQTNILAAVTGRMSVSNPPLQQMPPAARGIFLPDEGRKFVSIDYAQVEPFLVANVAGDLGVLKGYESGESDLYTDLAAFSEARGTPMPRKIAKVVLLAQLYGEGMGKLTKDLGLDPGPLVERENGTWTHTYDEARAIQNQIFEVMPATEKLIKNLRDASNRNRVMTSISGRVIPVPVYVNKETGKKTDVAGYKGVNYFVQGSAYDMLSEAIFAVDKAGLSDAVYLAVHDELIMDSEAAPDIDKIMKQPCGALVRAAGRVPQVQTEMSEPTERWQK